MSSAGSTPGSLRRVVLLVAGTVVGLVLVLSYRTPASNVATVGSASQSSGVTTSASGGGNGGSKPTPTTAATKTATGNTINTQFGPVQVQVTATGGKITDVQALALPNGDPGSSQVSAYAGPQLHQQALSAQSANINGVAGASYTSQGYQQSLQSALTQLGM